MHPRTKASLDSLREVEWFRHAGVHDAESAIILSTWEDAIASCASAAWIGLQHDAVDQYCRRIRERSPSDYERWNDVVLSVRADAVDLVREKTLKVVLEYGLPAEFLNAVSWDILHLCMEAEFADIYPPGFFAASAYWYANGHFPCGWQGAFPQGGQLVVF